MIRLCDWLLMSTI